MRKRLSYHTLRNTKTFLVFPTMLDSQTIIVFCVLFCKQTDVSACQSFVCIIVISQYSSATNDLNVAVALMIWVQSLSASVSKMTFHHCGLSSLHLKERYIRRIIWVLGKSDIRFLSWIRRCINVSCHSSPCFRGHNKIRELLVVVKRTLASLSITSTLISELDFDIILSSFVLPHSFLSSSNHGFLRLMFVIKLVSNPCKQTWHVFLNLLISFFSLYSEFPFSCSTCGLPLHLARDCLWYP